MARVHALVGVALCCLAVVVGCKTAEFGGALALTQTASNQTLPGSLDVVATDIVAKLGDLKIKVDTQTQDDKGSTYTLNCTTSGGMRFKLLLTRDGSGTTEKTNMHLEWVGASDNTFGLHLLVNVASQKAN